jgi:DNA polymerase III sliding clamp (beta) subunit (PCNA family)
MINLNINASIIRAAMANQATKDVRYYLTGILITTTGDIVGTDGHTCFVGKHTWEDCDTLPRDVILSIKGAIPISASVVNIQLDDIEGSATTKGIVRAGNKVLECIEIDGKYPDYKRVIPARLSDEYSNFLCFDASLLARIEKTFGKRAQVGIYTRGTSSSIRIESSILDGILVIMPMRIDKDSEIASDALPTYSKV